MQPVIQIDEKTKKITLAAASGVAVLSASTQANAAAPADVTSAVTDITGTMTALGTLAAAALGVVLVPFGISYALKFAKKVMSRG